MKEYKLNGGPFIMVPGDTLGCVVRDNDRNLIFREPIDRNLTIDTVVIFDPAQSVVSLSDNVGAVFGEAR